MRNTYPFEDDSRQGLLKPKYVRTTVTFSSIIGQCFLIALSFSATGAEPHSASPMRRPLGVLAPAFDISKLGPGDWLPLFERTHGKKKDTSANAASAVNKFIFYNQSTYPNELLIHVHIPKTGKWCSLASI